jgi:hypothetical protein
MSSVNLSIPDLVDEIDNKTEIDYRGWPDRLYVLGVDGRVFHKGGKGPAGFHPQEIVDALEILQTATKVELPGRLVSTWGAIRRAQAGRGN